MDASANAAADPLARLWARLGDAGCPVLRETWPAVRDLAFLPALREEATDRARDLELAHDFLTGLLRVPIIAVAGLLNAGKSSLVASFLEPGGRARVLRGLQRASGTHRFTLWCPGAWESDPSFRSSLEALLHSVFGAAPEGLAQARDAAHEQQRDRARLAVPLLAFDRGLDAHGMCLLDCPDIQRREEGEGAGSRRRRAVLEAAGRLCSAVFVVLPRSELEVEQVAEVLDALPRAQRVLLVNLCSAETPAAIAAEARAAWGDIATSIYVAYDFRHRGYESWTPAWDPNLRLPDTAPTDAAVPCFFAVAGSDPAHSPASVVPGRSLAAFAATMAPARLLQERQRALLDDLRRRVVVGGEFLAGRVRADQESVEAAAALLQEEFLRLLERDGDLRIKLDPALIEDFATSIRRTAPWDLKPFLWMSHKAAMALQAIRSVVRGVAGGIHERIREEGRRISEVLADSRVDADRIADGLRLWSAARRQARDRAFWLPVAERILQRFREEDGGRLPAGEWDERARDLWREVPVWRARTAVLTTMMIALAAVAVLSVAGGPILVALGIKSAALTVTVKELLVVIGLGSIAQGEAARRLDDWLRERVGARQRSDLVAIAFDEVGLPRSLLRALDAPPRVPAHPRPDGFAVRELAARQRSWQAGHWDLIRGDLQALGD